jgi:hypothetical protein
LQPRFVRRRVISRRIRSRRRHIALIIIHIVIHHIGGVILSQSKSIFHRKEVNVVSSIGSSSTVQARRPRHRRRRGEMFSPRSFVPLLIWVITLKYRVSGVCVALFTRVRKTIFVAFYLRGKVGL